jgi:D-alanyl-D-alanine carboxypeptidase
MLANITKAITGALLGATVLALPSPGWAGPTLLLDASDGLILYAEDYDNQWHPASLTKIMTAYVTFEALRAGTIKLDSKVGCSELAYLQPPSKVGLPVGAEMTVETALQALIVKSANDVAVMLAEGVAGSQDAFVARMNATAARLGMTRTKFVNPNGLPAPEQVTTARDLAKLAQAVIRDYPEHAPYWSQIDVKVGKRRLRTHNGLLTNYEGADGLKTGFICDSGFNVVATATREGRKLIAVVLGEATGRERTVRAASLLEHGFQTYGWKALFDPQKLDTMPMALGAKGPVTMRQAVISFECGTRRRPVAKKKGGKPKAVVQSNAAKGTAAKQAPSKPQAAPKAAQKAAASSGSKQ